VEHKKTEQEATRDFYKHDDFSASIRSIFESGDQADVTFRVGAETREDVSAHKAILMARSEYFRAMFGGGMREARADSVDIPCHEPASFKKMLEYVYSNDVRGLGQCSSAEILELLSLSSEYLLTDLTRLCEIAASRLISVSTLGSLFLIADNYDCSTLREACELYVSENISILKLEDSFRKDITDSPALALLISEDNARASPLTYIDF
jgi:hypothetical protein